MTMHMMGHAYTTLNTRKQKVKYTKAQQQAWTKDWHAQNKWNKARGFPKITLEEFIDQIHGKAKKSESQGTLTSQPGANYRETESYPSKQDSGGVAPKQEPMQYDGERKLVGIATMHKSNMVPVFEDGEDGKQYAKDLARMRR